MYTILYVDDESELLALGKIFLEQSGQFQVDIITSAPAALAQMNSKNYDAIISDYQMADMDGIEFLKTVRSSGNIIPFILFTGRGREEVVIEAINSGVDSYIQKGGEPEAQFAELAHKLRQAIQKHHADAGIRDLERRQADIINFLPDATFAIDTNGVVIAWNRAMEEITGVAASYILGKGNYEYAISGYHERQPILIDLVLNEDHAQLAKYPLLKRSGRTLIMETNVPFLHNGRGATIWSTATPLYDTKGIVTGAIQSIRDITEQKEVEEALRGSEEKFKTLFENAGDAILIMDHEVFLDCNKKTETIFGFTKDRIIGNSPTIFSPERQPDGRLSSEKAKEIIEAAFSGEPQFFEWSHVRYDSTPFYAEVSLNRVIVQGTTYLQVIIRDITTRKRAEAAAILARKKLDMMDEVTRHEIKNIITGLIGSVDMAYSLPAGGQREILNREIKNLTLKIQREIDFTEEFQKIGINPPEWQRVQQLIPSHRTLQIGIAPEIAPLEVYADPLLARIFLYLTQNVARHGVHATEIEIRVHPNHNSMAIIFEDNGIGIPGGMKEAIFTRKEGDRKGMGLFLVREILAITGITITENGEPGRGARFEIVVPSGSFRT